MNFNILIAHSTSMSALLPDFFVVISVSAECAEQDPTIH